MYRWFEIIGAGWIKETKLTLTAVGPLEYGCTGAYVYIEVSSVSGFPRPLEETEGRYRVRIPGQGGAPRGPEDGGVVGQATA